MSFSHKTKSVYTGILGVGYAALLVFSLPCAASVYYVDGRGGDDGRDGRSPERAWKTVAKVNSASLGAGDTVLFKRGCVWYETLRPANGKPDHPVTYGAYGEGAPPTIDGAGSLDYGIERMDAAWIVIENLRLRNYRKEGIRFLAWNSGVEHITIRNCTIQNGIHSCIRINAPRSSCGIYGVVVENCVLGPTSPTLTSSGIWIMSGQSGEQRAEKIRLRGNRIFECGEDGIIIDEAVDVAVIDNRIRGNGENSIDIKDCRKAVVRGNTCADDGEFGIVVHDDGVETGFTADITLTDNTVTGSAWGAIYCEFGKNYRVERNKASGFKYGGIVLAKKISNAVVAGNTVWKGGREQDPGIALLGVARAEVSHNTVYGMKGSGIVIGRGSSDLKVLNNICASNGACEFKVESGCTNITVSHNLFYPQRRSFIDFLGEKFDTVFDFSSAVTAPGIISASPLFTDPAKGLFTLRPESPARNAGTDAGRKFLESAPDLGAHEFDPDPGGRSAVTVPQGLRLLIR